MKKYSAFKTKISSTPQNFFLQQNLGITVFSDLINFC